MCPGQPSFRFRGFHRPGRDNMAVNCQFICVSGTVQSAIRGLSLTQVQPLCLHLRHQSAFQARTSNITCAGELMVRFVPADVAGKTFPLLSVNYRTKSCRHRIVANRSVHHRGRNGNRVYSNRQSVRREVPNAHGMAFCVIMAPPERSGQGQISQNSYSRE